MTPGTAAGSGSLRPVKPKPEAAQAATAAAAAAAVATVTAADPKAVAKAAILPELKARHLVFSHDGMPGYRRQRQGKGFRFLLPGSGGGGTLRDAEERRRILSLAIPPAWREVWICTHPQGHLQATGVDEKGRKQYRYHAQWAELSADRKFTGIADFARALPALRGRVAAALAAEGFEKERIVAGIVGLLDHTGYRIGNRRYASENRSYGLVSLLSRHLVEEDGQWVLRFRGKSGQWHRAEVRNARLMKLVAELHELPGQHLFRYERAPGQWSDIDTGDVNAWLKEAGGGDFTAKQFRTWRATVLCARELARLPMPVAVAVAASASVSALEAVSVPVPVPADEAGASAEVGAGAGVDANANAGASSGTKPKGGAGTSAAALRSAELAAVRATAARLHHTPAVCRQYYLHPAVMAAFRSGSLHRVMQGRPPKFPAGDRAGLLRADERRVLWLIEQAGQGHAARGKRGTRG